MDQPMMMMMNHGVACPVLTVIGLVLAPDHSLPLKTRFGKQILEVRGERCAGYATD